MAGKNKKNKSALEVAYQKLMDAFSKKKKGQKAEGMEALRKSRGASQVGEKTMKDLEKELWG